MFRKLLGACVGLAMIGMAGTVNAALMGRTGWSGRATLRFLICTIFALIPYGQVAEAAVILSTDSVSYNAASTTIVFSDFEGIVADSGALKVTPLVVDGVRYKDLEVGDGLICGRERCSGNPFDSATLIAMPAAIAK